MSESSRSDRQTPQVSIDQLQAYLQSKQWFEDGKIRNVATIWHQHQVDDAEVVLPFSSVKDFRQRVRDALVAVGGRRREERGTRRGGRPVRRGAARPAPLLGGADGHGQNEQSGDEEGPHHPGLCPHFGTI